MALVHLLDVLESESERTRLALLADAQARADRMRADAQALDERERASRRREAESAARADAAAHLARIRHDAETAILTARRTLIERVVAEARARLPERLGRDILQQHLEEAFTLAGTTKVEVICRPELEPAVRALVGDRATLRTDADAGWGVRIWIESIRLDLDNTVESRLERLRPWLALEIVRRAEHDGQLD